MHSAACFLNPSSCPGRTVMCALTSNIAIGPPMDAIEAANLLLMEERKCACKYRQVGSHRRNSSQQAVNYSAAVNVIDVPSRRVTLARGWGCAARRGGA